jgi:hypothetical protein
MTSPSLFCIDWLQMLSPASRRFIRKEIPMPSRIRWSVTLILIISTLFMVWSFTALRAGADYPDDGLLGLGRVIANLWFAVVLVGGAVAYLRMASKTRLLVRMLTSSALLLFAAVLTIENVPRLLTSMTLSVAWHQRLITLEPWLLFGGLTLFVLAQGLRIYTFRTTNATRSPRP